MKIGNSKLILAGMLTASFLAAHNPLWTDPEGATETLVHHGLEPIEVGGYRWDLLSHWTNLWKTEFTAKTARDEIVTGVVHKVPFRDSVVKIDR